MSPAWTKWEETWYVTVWSPGRWGDQVRTKGRPCISLLSHFIVRSYFLRTKVKRKKSFKWNVGNSPWLLRPSSEGILYQKNLLHLWTVSVKSHRTLSMYGEKSCIKKTQLAHKFKAGKENYTNFNLYFNCKWLAVIIPTISTYFVSYIQIYHHCL